MAAVQAPQVTLATQRSHAGSARNVVNNHKALRESGASIVLYLPKIQTAEEAALWNDMISALERHVGLPVGTIKVYVLVEQLEAVYQLMEIRAALGLHFIGFNTGRWDYINSVADALAWDPSFINPNIDAITMTYGYMRNYEDRVRRAMNTPDQNGRFALWQGGMEPNIPVGSDDRRRAGDGARASPAPSASSARAPTASGSPTGRWSTSSGPCGRRSGRRTRWAAQFPPLTYTAEDAAGLTLLEPAPRTVRGARDLLSVALQYGNAFLQGFQAAALKPGDFFGNEDVLYLMEDMATGEIRLSILWEWLHKRAQLTDADAETGAKAGDVFSRELFERLLREEYAKLQNAEQSRRARQLEEDHAARGARDRRDLCPRSDEAAVVHRPAEHHARRRGSGRSEAPDRAAARRVQGRRPTDHGEPRFQCGCVSASARGAMGAWVGAIA